MTLDVLGDGPMAGALAAQSADLGEAVQLRGPVPHEKVQQAMREADILIFPSVREFGGGVVLEAMAMGCVPLVVDYAGPGELVDKQTGLKVPIGTRPEIVTWLRSELGRGLAAPEQLAPLSQSGMARARDDFTWAAKARQVREVYDWVLSGVEGRPPVPLLPSGSR